MYAMPMNWAMPNLQNSYSRNKEEYVITATVEYNFSSRYCTEFLVASKLQTSIYLANERFFKETGRRLSSGNTTCLQCFDAIIDKTNVVFSFYDDRIKAKFSLNNKKYIFDFNLEDKNFVLIGKMEDRKYTLEELPSNNVGNYLASI